MATWMRAFIGVGVCCFAAAGCSATPGDSNSLFGTSGGTASTSTSTYTGSGSTLISAGTNVTITTAVVVNSANCGNGVLESGEQCDDGVSKDKKDRI